MPAVFNYRLPFKAEKWPLILFDFFSFCNENMPVCFVSFCLLFPVLQRLLNFYFVQIIVLGTVVVLNKQDMFPLLRKIQSLKGIWDITAKSIV